MHWNIRNREWTFLLESPKAPAHQWRALPGIGGAFESERLAPFTGTRAPNLKA